MNVFNRIVMILLAPGHHRVGGDRRHCPDGLSQLGDPFFEWLYENADFYANGPDWPYFAGGRVVIGGGLIIVCLFLLWLELRRPRKKTIRAQKMAGGEAHITVDSIAQRLAYNIDQLPDVIKVTPQIIGKGAGRGH